MSNTKFRIVSLLSGGIDSPVALYLMLQKVDDAVVIHYDNRPFTDELHAQKAIKLKEQIEKITGRKLKMYILSHGENQLEIARKCNVHYECILCRRIMWRCAERIAELENAQALVTGESLGQVASQTLSNIYVESYGLKIPIIRPLIGLDKTDIIKIAREIGTYDISIEPGLCCTAVPEKPKTKAQLEKVLLEEAQLDIDELVERCVTGRKLI